jgi:hypothetical protein
MRPYGQCSNLLRDSDIDTSSCTVPLPTTNSVMYGVQIVRRKAPDEAIIISRQLKRRRRLAAHNSAPADPRWFPVRAMNSIPVPISSSSYGTSAPAARRTARHQDDDDEDVQTAAVLKLCRRNVEHLQNCSKTLVGLTVAEVEAAVEDQLFCAQLQSQ